MTKELLYALREKQPLSRQAKFLVLSMIPVYFMVVGLILQPWSEIGQGLFAIVKEPDFLITDYMELGGIGAAFINAGLLTLASIACIYWLGMEMDGHTLTASCLMFGFSLFGKNILNIWSILMGIWLYAKYHKVPVKKYLYIGFYGTSLSPVITQVMRLGHSEIMSFLFSVVVGMVIGFVLPSLATHLYDTHKGYSLYNVGFASGIIATVIVSLFKSFGIESESRLIWYSGSNLLFAQLLIILFSAVAATGLITGNNVWKGYRNILKSYGIAGTDYVKSEGFSPTLLNMGINGIVFTVLILAIGGDLNGPTIGGIFTVVGFSATGKHLRNTIPVIAGVLLASFAKSWSITDPGPILALLLSTTLAPIAGEFGVSIGILAGFLHSSVALNVGIVYGGMNLYNNGFAGGMVAAFLVPVALSIKDRIVRAKEDKSL